MKLLQYFLQSIEMNIEAADLVLNVFIFLLQQFGVDINEVQIVLWCNEIGST